MERIKQQIVYDRADVNQLWSLIGFPGHAFHLQLFWILETVCSKSSLFKPEKTWLVDRYMQISVEK